MAQKKVVYIAGPITGVNKYWEAFERVEDDLSALGYIPLSPAHLPQGMTNEQYTRIDTAMLDSADAVVFLPGFENSRGASLEYSRCQYIGKPYVFYKDRTLDMDSVSLTREQSRDLLRLDLEVVTR